MLESRIRRSIDSLLAIEHRRFGAGVGLLTKVPENIPFALLAELVYSIDELSWSKDEYRRRLGVQVIALVWEHASQIQREGIRDLLVTSLARLGVSPSIRMLETQFAGDELLAPLHSYSAEVASSLMQYEFCARIGPVEHTLTRFQRLIMDAIDDNRVVGISAPTSAGKSFALYLSIVRHALRDGGPVVYIVPTISLINQVSADVRNLLDSHGLEHWSVRTGLQKIAENCIYVLTQERALPGTESGRPVQNIGFLVVDEIQNLERVQDDGDLRAKVLFDALRELRELSPSAKIVLSGPRVNNVGDLGRQIFGVRGAEVATSQSPVANITYGVSSRKGVLYLNQYTEFHPKGLSLPLDNVECVKGLGQSRYTPEFIQYLRSVIESGADDASNIVFAPTSAQARKTAVDLASSRGEVMSSAREELANYLAETIHPKYALVGTVRQGIGFHSGRVPPHARLAIEQAFSEGLLKDVVCTTTLMQGVNLPANLVVVRNPQLFINKRKGRQNARLSPYEFANLRGRAGRLMKDFVGRTLVLDEDSFLVDSGQEELFPNAEKTISAGYVELFARNREQVEAELAVPGTAARGASKFLAAYVRQTILRHGEDGGKRLRDVGVEVPAALLRRVSRELRALDIPREVCLSNRYWDPIDLQIIKDNMDGGQLNPLPNEPWTSDEEALHGWLIFQNKVAPYYFNRYLGDATEKRLRTLSISAVAWARERPLSEIIRKRHFSGDVSEQVEQQISDIYKHVVYGIPSLLKPIADLQGSGHGLLAAVESGVFNPVTRFLIERGLYRETAIYVQRKALSGLTGEGDSLSRAVAARLLRARGFGYWVERQVDPIVRQMAREI